MTCGVGIGLGAGLAAIVAATFGFNQTA